MNKEEVLYLFDKYKDRPIEIDTGDSAAVLRGNIDGHWLFLKGDTVVEVKKNTPDVSALQNDLSSSPTIYVSKNAPDMAPERSTSESVHLVRYEASPVSTK